MSAAKRIPGQPGRIVSWFRNILIGRPVDATPWLRTVDCVSSRSPPPPNIPGGPAHRLAANYYYSRDLRRGVAPPSIASTFKQLPTAQENLSMEEVVYPQIVTPPTPGSPYHPDKKP